MRFSEIYSKDRAVLWFEFFPPKLDTELPATKDLIRTLSLLEPDFMTVTYGAGGGTRDRTQDLVSFIVNELKVSAAAHLTCVGHTQAEIDRILSSLLEENIRNIVALRGDPPKGAQAEDNLFPSYICARDLVRHIQKQSNFSVAVAGYPEAHPQAESLGKDIAYLKEKVDAGAEIIITQLFFDAALYFAFVGRCRAIGIEVPIVPGIMPISNVKQLRRFTEQCGASIPSELRSELEEIEGDAEQVRKYGTRQAIKQCRELLNGGAPGIHLFTLNKSSQVEEVVRALRSEGYFL